MRSRGSPVWGVLMGAVGLTFVLTAVFLAFIAERGGMAAPGTPTAEPILLPGEGSAEPAEGPPDAAPAALAIVDAGPPRADAAPAASEDAGEEASPSEASSAVAAGSMPSSAGAPALSPSTKKPTTPTKTKVKTKTHHR